MPTSPGWSKDEDTLLIKLWRERKSFGQIAWEFVGRSRNACIGRIGRLRKVLGVEEVPAGREGRKPLPVGKKRKRGQSKTNFNIKTRSVPVAPTKEKIPFVPVTARQLSLLELGPKDCRFIVTGSYTRRHLYCAADASANVDDRGNNCYCNYHQRLMHTH